MDVMKSSLTKSLNVVKEKAAASIDHLQSQHNKNRTNQSKANTLFSPPVQQQNQKRQQREGKEEVAEVLEWVNHEFFLACQKNNSLRAYELYTMPYQTCVEAMVQQQQHIEQREQQQKQDMIDKLLFRKKDVLSAKGWFKADNTKANISTDGQIPSRDNQTSCTAHSTIHNATTALGFLEEQKNPCEFFPPSYFSTLLQQQSALAKPTALAQKLKEKIMKKSFMAGNTNSQQQLSPTSVSTTTPITTTPLHEVARLGYPPLLRRMLLFQKMHVVDLSIQDWKQRTVLHYACGGSNGNNNQEDQDSSLRSFYQCTMDQKRRKGKERFTQVLRNKLDNDWTKQLLSETKSELARLLPTTTTNKSNPTSSDTTTSNNNNIHSTSNLPIIADEECIEKDTSNRLECLLIIFSISQDHQYHRPVRINTVDCRVRTALHYASSLNRYSLVRSLLSQPDILVSIIDEGGRTACDLSSSEDVQDILEAKALFSSEEDYDMQLQHHQQQHKPWFETWDNTRIDLERQSIIETAQNQIQQQFSSSPSLIMRANYPLCATLLEKYNWNVESFISSLTEKTDVLSQQPEVEEQIGSHETATRTCLICYSTDVDDNDWTAMKDCPHGFCTCCLQEYITTNYVNPTTRTSSIPTLRIPCPHYECQRYISESQLSTLVSSQDLSILQQGERELFILSYRPQRFKFCPHVRCSGIVHACPPLEYQSRYGENCWKYMGAICTGNSIACTTTKQDSVSLMNIGTFCKSSNRVHRFCFSCSSLTPHWPASCEYHAQWVATVEEQMKGISSSNNFDDVAHHLWLKANTRPCPKCNTPIEKNDGCNHMICLNRHCRYEFCWICRKDWSLHSTRTGGYFLCNRWAEDEEPADDGGTPSISASTELDIASASISATTELDTAIASTLDTTLAPLQGNEILPTIPQIEPHQPSNNLNAHMYGTSMYTARTTREQAKRMARFIFYYGRWTAQQESSLLEAKIASTLEIRLRKMLAIALKESEYISLDVPAEVCAFVHDAFDELRECRSVLQHSYAYAFFRFAPQSDTSRDIEKLMFEHWQSELEAIVEQLSNAVARSHLRASRAQIMQLSQAAAQRRIEFSIHVISVRHEEAQSDKRLGHLNNHRSADAGLQQESPADGRGEDEPAPTLRLEQQYLVRGDDSPGGGLSDILERILQLERTDTVVNSGSHDDDSSFGLLVENDYFVLAQAEEEVQLQRALEASMSDMIDEGNVTTWVCSNCTYLNSTSSRSTEPIICALCNITHT